MEEIITYSSATTAGTTTFVFTTCGQDVTPYFDEVHTSFLLFDAKGSPTSIHYLDGNQLFIRDGAYNNFVPLTSVTQNFITGNTGVIRTDYVVSDSQKAKYQTRYSNLFLGLDASSRTFFFYENIFDDVFLNVVLNRSFDALSTMSVYNTMLNSYPTMQSQTGVVFGRLEAVQQVVNPDTGLNYRIPLRDVPIGIFNPSSDFPQTTSVDGNGNRLALNYQPILSGSPFEYTSYFNTQSLNFDDKFLQDVSTITSVPDQCKYVTKTNQNGEFIIYDVPIGSQTVMFDVDLLKQGLTKDEVALNFFPYPTSDSPNIDSVPHFFFRQLPISVVPTWGDIQTGYTELNFSVNLDLKKWATFYIPPISYLNKNLEDLQSQNNQQTPLSIYVRDMTKKNFSFDPTIQNNNYIPKDLSQIVEIPDDLNRDTDQVLLWYNEFAQQIKVVQSLTKDFIIFKVPANMYSPYIYNSIESDKLSNKKIGTWFCGYQFDMTYNFPSIIYRSTGFNRVGTNSRSNFFLNNYVGTDFSLSNQSVIGKGFTDNVFPYEKPWSISYPDQVKIPVVPSSINPLWDPNTHTSPKYTDGDLIGFNSIVSSSTSSIQSYAGGMGLQYDSGSTMYFPNRFSKRVTRGYVYKYESGVSLYESYSNGYRPQLNNESFVQNGEKYQRVEAGFGYFLKPEGWSDTFYGTAYDYVNSGFTYLDQTTGTYQVGTYVDPQDDMYLKFDINSQVKDGGLDIYRIVDPLNINSPDPNITPTFTKFVVKYIYRKVREESALIMASIDGYNGILTPNPTAVLPILGASKSFNFNDVTLNIYNRGEIPADMDQSGNMVNPGDFISSQLFGNDNIFYLPGNSGFDITTFSYKQSKYDFQFGGYDAGAGGTFGGQTFTVPTIGFTGEYAVATPGDFNSLTDEYDLITQYDNNVQIVRKNKRHNCIQGFESGIGKLEGIILGAERNIANISLPSGSIGFKIFSLNDHPSPSCDGSYVPFGGEDFHGIPYQRQS